jgi:hypothetical protein
MNKFFKNKLLLGLIVVLSVFSSCDTLDTNLTEDDSSLNPDNADMDLLFNRVMLGYNDFFNTMQYGGAQVTRIEVMRTTSYDANFPPSTFNSAWEAAYQRMLINNKLVLSKLSEVEARGGNVDRYKAASKILEASTWVMLVDYFGNIPFSEALQGSLNFNPKRDDARTIYNACYQMLNDAISLIDNLPSNSLPIKSDIYYSNNMNNWKRAANSIKLQMIINSRLQNTNATTEFNSILSNNTFINSNSFDFQFNYKNSSATESRHPVFRDQYVGEASTYLSGNFISYMSGDPREPYYFYRQTPAGDTFARVHGSTLPNVGTDYTVMTVHGVYPYGGASNDSSNGSTTANMGLLGAGVNVFVSNYSTQFLIAEGQLTINNNPSLARQALSNAVTAHLNKVMMFGQGIVTTNAMTSASINSYVNNVLTEYDNASDKLEIIMREYYKASWGNGYQAYNNYRRTGKPNNLALLNNGGNPNFAYSMPYPAVYLNNNTNSDNVFKPISERVWWANPSLNLNF